MSRNFRYVLSVGLARAEEQRNAADYRGAAATYRHLVRVCDGEYRRVPRKATAEALATYAAEAARCEALA